MLERFRCRVSIEVQFRDLDPLGHVNNAVYFSYLESARVAYLRALTGHVPAAAEIGLVLVEAACRYRSPALLGEWLEVGIRVSHLRRSSFVFEYQVRCRDDGRLVAEARTVQTAFESRTGRVVPLSAEFRAHIERYEGCAFDPRAPIPPWER